VPPPPPLRIELRPAAPAAHWFWVEGHWRWDGQRHQWEPGRWVEPRHGESHVPARWALEGGIWVYHPARWQRAPAAAGPIAVAIPAPPPLRHEVVPRRPGPGTFWIEGHWRWERGTHVWVAGRWERERRQERWVPSEWKLLQGSGWTFVEGHWSRR
jgi:hypothetical protein